MRSQRESSPALVLLPGLLCDRDVWAGQIAALGESCIVPQYQNLDSIVAMARRVLDEAPPRFALAGHSMGGRVALEVVRTAPERISRLALLDTGYEARKAGEPGEEEARGRRHLVDVARERGMRAMGTEWVQGMVHPAHLADSVLIERILAMIERQTPAAHAAQIRALLERPDASDVLSQIRCPTLIACGREDLWSPLERHQAMAALIPGSQLVVIEHCGHMSTMEQPAAVTAAMRRWLQQGG
ncbi:MAG TPA: alpha/beta fold hydrolase [Steroidobacteraceae bacterium]|nr:alpha/beta fold hydrolase [Steroidobacteraceae bacterium]